MQVIIELKKHEDKDYTMFIYEGIKLIPVVSVKTPQHWNKIVTILTQYLRAKGIINVYQKKACEDKLLVMGS
jgi:hypothetical protein